MSRPRLGVTDRDCLRAAERALAAHLALRPATRQEAAAIAAEHRAVEQAHTAYATRLRSTRMPTAAEIGRGPGALSQQHVAAAGVAVAIHEALHVAAAADRARGQAEAWERVSQGEGGEAYRETERELRARVAHYRGHVRGGQS